MRILILGGTRFFGSFLTEQALARGHEVTLLHRGQVQVAGFEGAAHIVADRRDGHGLLAGREFDVVVDTSGYSPAVVGDAVRVLEPSVERYLFVSSVSAYADLSRRGIDESATLATLPSDIAAAAASDLHWLVDMNYYGALKAAAEDAVTARFGPERTTVVRPGLIVGPRDYTYRFNHWVKRMSEGGEVLAPAPGNAPAQVIDARDLAAFALHLVEHRIGGVFNANGEPTSMQGVLESIAAGIGSQARPVWVAPDFLLERGVEPWSDLPLWLPDELGGNDMAIDRARAAGLVARPLRDTARDTLEWMAAAPPGARPKQTSLAMDRERELLDEWARAATQRAVDATAAVQR